MKGQKMKRVRPASAGACRNSRGTPPYSTQRQQHADPQQDNTEASPTVFESGSLLFVAELFVEGYLIEESLTLLSTGYTAANYAVPSTTSDVGPKISCYCRVSWDVVPPTPPPYPGAVEEPDPLSAVSLATAPERYAPDSPDTFLAPTPAMNGTPAAAMSTIFLPPERKEPAALCVENEVRSTPDKADAAGVSAAAAMSEVRASPQDVLVPSSQDLTSQAPPQLLTTPPQRQQQPLAAAQQNSGNSPGKSTVEEVARFIAGITGCERSAWKYRDHRIDGYALFLMKKHHLMMAMKMELGLALKLCAIIDSLRELP